MNAPRERQLKLLTEKYKGIQVVVPNIEYMLMEHTGLMALQFNIKLPPGFPTAAPIITTVPPMVHHITDETGRITKLPILERWSAQNTIPQVIDQAKDAFTKTPPQPRNPHMAPGGGNFYPAPGQQPNMYPNPGQYPPNAYPGAPQQHQGPYPMSGMNQPQYPPGSSTAYPPMSDPRMNPANRGPQMNPYHNPPMSSIPNPILQPLPALDPQKILSVIDGLSLEELQELDKDEEKLKELILSEKSLVEAKAKLVEAEKSVGEKKAQLENEQESLRTLQAELEALMAEESQLRASNEEKNKRATELERELPRKMIERLDELIHLENTKSEHLLKEYLSNPSGDFKAFCDSYLSSRKAYHLHELSKKNLSKAKIEVQPVRK